MKSAFLVGIARLLIETLPAAIPAFQALLAKKQPTDADYAAAEKQIEEDTFEKLVPEAVKFPDPAAGGNSSAPIASNS